MTWFSFYGNIKMSPWSLGKLLSFSIIIKMNPAMHSPTFATPNFLTSGQNLYKDMSFESEGLF